MSGTAASIFLRHRAELLSYLSRRLRDRHLAAELVQEVYLRVAERDEFGTQRNPRAYLYRVASNLAVDHERRMARRQSNTATDGGLPPDLRDEQPGPDHCLEQRDRLNRVRGALSELPSLTQEIVRLVRLEGLTYAAAARELGVSESSVQKHLARGVALAAGALAAADKDAITGSAGSNVIPTNRQTGKRRS